MAATTSSTLFSVTGKNVLVTGGSRGIGLMIASTFVRHGANVLISSRDPKACEEAAKTLLAQQHQHLQQHNDADASCKPPQPLLGSVHHISSNISTREGCKELAQHTHTLFNGRLDVLINNAGASWGEDPGYDINARESGKMNWGWDKVLDVNVKGVFYLTRECVPMLQRRRVVGNDEENNSGGTQQEQHHQHDDGTEDALSTSPTLDSGRIINIGSVTGFLPQEAPTHAYDISKAAVHHLTKKLAADLAPRGITVNAIAPGYVLTRMSKGLVSWTKDGSLDEFTKSIPLGRMGNEDDMGGACLYFASRAGAWCTGVILNVDGGTVGTMQIPLSNL